MAVWNIVKFSELGPSLRIDSDYYRPYHMKIEGIVKKKPNSKLGKFIKKFDSGLNIPQCDYDPKITPFVRTQNVRPILINYNGLTSCFDFPNFKKAKEGDILIVRVGEGVGNFSIVTDDFDDSAFSDNVIRIRFSQEIDPYFLICFLNSSFGKTLAEKVKKGTARSLISRENIEDITIPLFEKEKTLEFKKMIKTAIEKRNLSRSLLSSAESLLLSELGLDKLDLPKSKWNVRNYSETKEERRMDGEYYLPKYYALLEQLRKFDIKRLGEIVSYKKGVEVGAKEYIEEGIPFWRVSDLSKEEIGGTNTAFISNELYRELKNKFEAKTGEILFSKDATPGIASYLRESLDGIICSGILRLKLKEKVEPDYLTLLLNSKAVKMQIEREGGGSIISHLRPDSAMNLVIPILDERIQKEISDKVRESHKARKEAKELLEKAKRKVEEMILAG